MKRRIILPTLLALVATLLPACKDDPTSPTQTTAPLVGTWQLMSVDGSNASLLGASWTFTDKESTFRQSVNGCQSTFSYKLNGNKMINTILQDGCEGEGAGTVDTIGYTVSGNHLTLTLNGGVTLMLEKSATSANAPLPGAWQVTKVDGAPVSSGVTTTMTFTAGRIDIQTVSGGAFCETVFDFELGVDDLYLTTVSDDCSGIEPGTEDLVQGTISGTTLTLVFSDGTTIEAVKK